MRIVQTAALSFRSETARFFIASLRRCRKWAALSVGYAACYSEAMQSAEDCLVVVDGYNLLHAAILSGRDRQHWWSPQSQRRVLQFVREFNPDPAWLRGAERVRVWLVFDRTSKGTSSAHPVTLAPSDGEPWDVRSGIASEPIGVHYAPDADEWIVQCCERRAERCALKPGGKYRTVVVSADRALQDRCARWGSERLSPWRFAELCGDEGNRAIPCAMTNSGGASHGGDSPRDSGTGRVPERRLIALEEKMAYLEKLASELNDVVVEQASTVEQLLKRVRLLEKQAVATGEGREFPHEKPPHY